MLKVVQLRGGYTAGTRVPHMMIAGGPGIPAPAASAPFASGTARGTPAPVLAQGALPPSARSPGDGEAVPP